MSEQDPINLVQHADGSYGVPRKLPAAPKKSFRPGLKTTVVAGALALGGLLVGPRAYNQWQLNNTMENLFLGRQSTYSCAKALKEFEPFREKHYLIPGTIERASQEIQSKVDATVEEEIKWGIARPDRLCGIIEDCKKELPGFDLTKFKHLSPELDPNYLVGKAKTESDGQNKLDLYLRAEKLAKLYGAEIDVKDVVVQTWFRNLLGQIKGSDRVFSMFNGLSGLNHYLDACGQSTPRIKSSKIDELFAETTTRIRKARIEDLLFGSLDEDIDSLKHFSGKVNSPNKKSHIEPLDRAFADRFREYVRHFMKQNLLSGESPFQYGTGAEDLAKLDAKYGCGLSAEIFGTESDALLSRGYEWIVKEKLIPLAEKQPQKDRAEAIAAIGNSYVKMFGKKPDTSLLQSARDLYHKAGLTGSDPRMQKVQALLSPK